MTRRRLFLKKLTFAGMASWLIPAYANSATKKQEQLFIHHVFFWLKDINNPEIRIKFEKALEELGSVPSIKFLHIGKPADTNREIIETSYHYSFLVGFKNKLGHDDYQVHPIHDKFRNESGDMWNKVLIYDSENISG